MSAQMSVMQWCDVGATHMYASFEAFVYFKGRWAKYDRVARAAGQRANACNRHLQVPRITKINCVCENGTT